MPIIDLKPARLPVLTAPATPNSRAVALGRAFGEHMQTPLFSREVRAELAALACRTRAALGDAAAAVVVSARGFSVDAVEALRGFLGVGATVEHRDESLHVTFAPEAQRRFYTWGCAGDLRAAAMDAGAYCFGMRVAAHLARFGGDPVEPAMVSSGARRLAIRGLRHVAEVEYRQEEGVHHFRHRHTGVEVAIPADEQDTA